jgi:photosystem II stability/assembly factor-like uncharacterized protein
VRRQFSVVQAIIDKMRTMRKLMMIVLAGPFVFGAVVEAQGWTVQTSGIQTNLRGLSVVRGSNPAKGPVVWASGSNGVILQSADGGKNWKRLYVEGGDALDFRGIRAFDEKIAYVMSSGDRDKSRIYKTNDGGDVWELQYTNEQSGFFLDDIACFDEKHCFALGDPIGGKFLILSTEDGRHWGEMPRSNMPAIIQGEGAFAASGTSLVIYGKTEIYFGTGGGAKARVFHSADLGRTWTVADTPLAAGNASSGVFSVVRVGDTVIAVGGDYKVANGNAGNAVHSTDGGVTWMMSSQFPGGFRSAVASRSDSTLIAVGPSGEDISRDGGTSWTHCGSLNLNAVAAIDAANVWAAGAHGTVARFSEGQSN